MNPVNTYKDMQPFAGCVVAFQSKSDYFHRDFSFEDAPEVKFATLSEKTASFREGVEDSTGFTLYEFLKPKSVMMHYVLDKPMLERSSLLMRAATPNEINKLRHVTHLGKALHCHLGSWDFEWEILKKLAEKRFARVS